MATEVTEHDEWREADMMPMPQRVKYLYDQLRAYRSNTNDQQNVIENMALRYDMGIIVQDTSRTDPDGARITDSNRAEELKVKSVAMLKRTTLENFELREMVNELRDENFHLRNEIYELVESFLIHFDLLNITFCASLSLWNSKIRSIGRFCRLINWRKQT